MGKGLRVIDTNHIALLVVSIRADLTFDSHRDHVPIFLGHGALLRDLILVVLAHRDIRMMEGLSSVIRSAFAAVTPERAVGHEPLEVKHLLSPLDLPLGNDGLPRGGRYKIGERRGGGICPDAERDEADNTNSGNDQSMKPPILLDEQRLAKGPLGFHGMA